MDGQLVMTDGRRRAEAQEAWEMRSKGKSIGYILDNTDFETPHDIVQALQFHNAEMAISTKDSRAEQVQMEIARIDAVQSEMWDVMEAEVWKYDNEGTATERDYDIRIKAAKVVLDCVKQRSALLGLTETDIQQAQAAVLIVGSDQGSYIKGLIDAIPEHSRPKDTQDFVLQLEANPAD